MAVEQHTGRSPVGRWHGDRALLWRAFIVAGIAAFVLWRLVTEELTGYLALTAPEWALKIDPSNAAALAAVANRILNGVEDEGEDDATAAAGVVDPLTQWSSVAGRALQPGMSHGPRRLTEADRERVRTMAAAALSGDPWDANALRILGQLADAGGDKQLADRYMRAAVSRSASASYAVYWLMIEAAKSSNWPEALHYADMLLRKRPQMWRFIFPLLIDIGERVPGDGRAALGSILALNPPWRAAFFKSMAQHLRDEQMPLKLFLALKDSSAPPAAAEINAYLDFLAKRKAYELAYYVWLQFLPSEALARIGNLVNGSFENDPSGAPFDWKLSGGDGVTIDIADRPDADGARALFIEFGAGRVQFAGVSQLVLLAPGSYTFSGRLQGDLYGRRGLQWRMTCLPSQTIVAETEMFLGTALQWMPFALEFHIPPEGCRAQDLRLVLAARSGSEEFASGAIWYDALKLGRLHGAQP